jgi:Xaa-Pro aminopeptidase
VSGARAERLADAVAERGLDHLIVGDLVRPGDSGPDAISIIRWLTGFSGTSGLALIGPGQRVFLTDFRYTDRAAKEVDKAFERVIVGQRMLPEVAARVAGKVGFDDAQTSVQNLRKLEEELPDGVELVPAGGIVEDLRRTKDADEVEAIDAASRIADAAFEWIAEQGLAGRTELDVARALEGHMRELGAEPSFGTIVGSGPNGALPHATPSDRVIGEGELVVIDMGAKLDGYCSDGTRTFASGELDETSREIYELVREAQQAGLDAIRAGVGGAEADAAARELIVAAGRGEEFGHGLGHGVGLEVHEAPRLGPRSEDTLQTGDVVSVEPGIYVEGLAGVRIEDLVVVTDDGYRNLSSTGKELRVVG